MWLQVRSLIATFEIFDVIDIIVVAVVIYHLYIMFKRTKAMTLLKGLLILLFTTALCKWLGLNVLFWLLEKSMAVIMVALPIVFQPELRRGLEKLGSGYSLLGSRVFLDKEEMEQMLKEITEASRILSSHKIGALVVFERKTSLDDYIDTGTEINGTVSSELLVNIFFPKAPLHDGAVIIRNNKLVAASCLLPLTENRNISKELGTRHRAAMGATEQTDAVVLVVSEETGTISIACNGKLERHLTLDELKMNLSKFFLLEEERKGLFWLKWKRWWDNSNDENKKEQ